MDVKEAVAKRRSIRRFDQKPIPVDILKEMVNAARIAPASANMQPLQYIVCAKDEIVKQLFPLTRWAGYLAPDGTPGEGEQPTAYIVILINKNIANEGSSAIRDVGAAGENIILQAQEYGVGSCWLGSIQRPQIRELLSIPEHLVIDTMIALGYPAETPVMEDMTDSIKYYKDDQDVLHVPKRRLDDIMQVID